MIRPLLSEEEQSKRVSMKLTPFCLETEGLGGGGVSKVL